MPLTMTTLHTSAIDIDSKTRSKMVETLNHALAHVLDLKTQVKQAHWNVKGLHFYPLHQLFDTLATELEEYTDTLAERATALGGTAFGTARMAIEQSTLPDYPKDISSGKDHLKALVERFAQTGKLLRESIEEASSVEDADTADVFTQISRGLDKQLWFLEAHLQD